MKWLHDNNTLQYMPLTRNCHQQDTNVCSRVLQLKDENVWLLLHRNAIKVHMCLTYQLVTVIIESGQGKERNSVIDSSGLQESGELCSIYNKNPAKLADVWCLELCAETLFVLLLKFDAILSIICGFLMVVSCWRRILQCIVIVQSFLRLLKLRKLAVC